MTHPSGNLIVSYGPDGLLMVPFKITSFTVSLNGSIIKTEGNHFSKEQLDKIRKAMNGSTLVISDICAQTPTGSNLRLAPIFLTVR